MPPLLHFRNLLNIRSFSSSQSPIVDACLKAVSTEKNGQQLGQNQQIQLENVQKTTQNAQQAFENVQNNEKFRQKPAKKPNVIHVRETSEDLFKFLNDPAQKGKQWTRFLRLNEHLKGHRPGELTIVTGPTGSGKTTFVSEYSLDLCAQGVTTLWGSFELRYMTLEKIMMIQLLGRHFDPSNREDFDATFKEYAKLPLYFLNFHGQSDIKVILAEARRAVTLHGVQHLVIDNLQFMLGLSPDSAVDRFHKQDLVLGMVRQFATEFNCHVTLVAHPRKEKEEMDLSNNSLYGGVKASQEADNILILMNKHNPRYRCSKYIQITKNRAYGNLGVVPLFFDKNSLCFSKPPAPKGPAQNSGSSSNSGNTFHAGSGQSSVEHSQFSRSDGPSLEGQEYSYESFKQFLTDQDRNF